MYRDDSRSSASPDSEEKVKDSAAKYEQERIQVLQQERVHVQKKTFTKWCNSFLEKVRFFVKAYFWLLVIFNSMSVGFYQYFLFALAFYCVMLYRHLAYSVKE